MEQYERIPMEEESLIERILSDENMNAAIRSVVKNKGAPGVDKMTVQQVKYYYYEHAPELKALIREGKYSPQAVRRVYIPKPNGKLRPLGIPTVIDRVVQQAVAQILSRK